jgi:hypothetical protein
VKSFLNQNKKPAFAVIALIAISAGAAFFAKGRAAV